MKVKTADLIGPALDWAVAKCENFDTRNNFRCQIIDADDREYSFICHAESHEHAEEQAQDAYPNSDVQEIEYLGVYSPSANWSQGGPIIESEKIALLPPNNHREGSWKAFYYEPSQHDLQFDEAISYSRHGPTPLIAAMRCFVASRLGNEIEIPEELM